MIGAIPTAELGDGLTVSAMGFGAMALTPVYGAVDDVQSLATLSHCLDIGISFIDTADAYGGGANERLIARLLDQRRDEVVLATKFGIVGSPADRGGGDPSIRGDAAYIHKCVDESLLRLQTDVIDLYYMHRRDLRLPIEETVAAMAELVKAGKVRHLGLSEVTADELRAAAAVHPIAALQSEWSVWSRDVERKVVPTAAELGVAFVPYSPLGRGFLAGAIRSQADLSSPGDLRRRLPRFAQGVLETNLAAVQVLITIADEQGATAAQVALAWLRQRAEALNVVSVPIPGTRRSFRVDENVASFSVTLTQHQLAALDTIAPAIAGGRSPYKGWVSAERE